MTINAIDELDIHRLLESTTPATPFPARSADAHADADANADAARSSFALRILRLASDLFELATAAEQGDRGSIRRTVDAGDPPAITVDDAAFKAWVGGQPLALTYREFRLLSALIANSGRVLTRDDLMRKAWDRPGDSGGRTVDVHIRRLRIQLGAASTRVATVRNVGYRFD